MKSYFTNRALKVHSCLNSRSSSQLNLFPLKAAILGFSLSTSLLSPFAFAAVPNPHPDTTTPVAATGGTSVAPAAALAVAGGLPASPPPAPPTPLTPNTTTPVVPGAQTAQGGTAPTTQEMSADEARKAIHQRDGMYSVHSNVTSSDQCPYSATVSGSYSCNGTINVVQGAQMSNMLTQTAGAMTTGALGQSAQIKAMTAGTQTAALEAAASTQMTTGEVLMGMGGVNAALGAYQLYKYAMHNKHARDLAAGGNAGATVEPVAANGANATDSKLIENEAGWATAKGSNAVGKDIINQFNLNQDADQAFNKVDAADQGLRAQQIKIREEQGKRHESDTSSRMRQIGQTASSEQGVASNAAIGGGIMSMMTGVQQMMSGGFNIAAAQQLKDQIKKLNQTNTPTLQPVPGPSGNPSIASADSFSPPGALSSDGVAQNLASSQDAGTNNTPPDLGTGFNPNPLPSGLPEVPPAGRFSSDNPPPSAGGGAPPMMGQGTPPADPQEPEPQPHMAGGSDGTGYGSGGTFSGGSGGGKGAEGGPDLSALLEKFLPKKDEEAKTASSLNFNERMPGQVPYSFLDRNVNIFQRVTEAYRDKQKSGSVGI